MAEISITEYKNLITNKNKSNKFGAQRCEYNGIKFASKKEMNYCKELDLRIKAGEIVKYELQKPLSYLSKSGKVLFKYLCDFVVYFSNNKIEYIDTKGCKYGASYQLFRLKKKLIEDQYGIKIIEK